MDLDELEAGRARLEFEYKGRPLVIEYRPEKVSMRLQRGLVAMANPPHDPSSLIDELASLLVAWSITRNGDPVPVDAEGVASLPMALLMELPSAIMDDFRDPKSPIATVAASASSMPSPAGSAPTDDSATSRPSLASSSMPDGPASLPGSSPGSLIRLGA